MVCHVVDDLGDLFRRVAPDLGGLHFRKHDCFTRGECSGFRCRCRLFGMDFGDSAFRCRFYDGFTVHRSTQPDVSPQWQRRPLQAKQNRRL